ncbi:MAG: DUF1573 domain-containing protein [Silvanigrellaceae bacterium]
MVICKFSSHNPRARSVSFLTSAVLASFAASMVSLAAEPNAKSEAINKATEAQAAEAEKGSLVENLQGQKPQIDFASMRYDFGEITRGQKVSYAFEFKNVGSGALQIRSIHSACGCVNTRVEPKDILMPGEKGKISFEFDSSHFAGNIVRTLTVDTNQTRNSTLTLSFSANIREEIKATPALLGVGEILPEYNKAWLIPLPTGLRATGSESETIPAAAEKAGLPASVLSQLKDSGEVKPVSVTTSHPSIAAEIIPPAAKGKDYQLKVIFKGGLPIGPLREKVSVWNSSRHLKELIVPIYGDVVGHVKQSAKYIEFGVVTRPEAVQRTLTLSSDRKDFLVESVTAELRRTDSLEGVGIADVLKYSTSRTATGTVLSFELRYPENISSGSMPVNASGFFIVKTNDPDYKEMKVPFFGVLRRDTTR